MALRKIKLYKDIVALSNLFFAVYEKTLPSYSIAQAEANPFMKEMYSKISSYLYITARTYFDIFHEYLTCNISFGANAHLIFYVLN